VLWSFIKSIYFTCFIIFLFLTGCGNDTHKKAVPEEVVFLDEPSSIGTKENPQARFEYEHQLLADPLTGRIPAGIERKSVKFSRRISNRTQANQNARLSTSLFEAEPWIPRGPYNIGGRTRALAIDYSNEDVLIAGGVSGGIWRSEDGGRNWGKMTTQETVHSVTCITQDLRPGKENIWYYGTGELQGNSARGGDAPFRGDGIFKSIDGGKSWFSLTSTGMGENHIFNNQFQYIWNITTNPDNFAEDEVIAAIYGAIVRSTDGGESWQVVLGENFLNQDLDLNQAVCPYFTDIARTEDGSFYATLSQFAIQNRNNPVHGIFHSGNGTEWVNITPRTWPTRYRRTIIATSASKPGEVYFLADSEPYRFFKFILFEQDQNLVNGIWRDHSGNIPNFGGNVGDFDSQDSYNMVLAVHPLHSEVLFMGGTNLYRSADGFSTENSSQWIGGYDTTNNRSVYPNHYVDQHAVVFYPSNPNRMLTGNDGGVQITENNLAPEITWRSLNNGYVTAQFYTVALNRFSTDNFVSGGMQDNGSYLTDSRSATSDWRRILGGDGGYCDISRDGLFYYFSFQDGQIYRITLNSSFRLTSFARVDPDGAGERNNQSTLFINPFVLDPHNSNIMYFAGGDQIWRNLNLTQIPRGSQDPTSINWEALSETRLPEGSISALAISYQPSNVLYYGSTRGRLYRLTGAGTTNLQVKEITNPLFPSNGYISGISVDYTNAEHLMVAFSNYQVISLFRSLDGGLTFEPVAGNLEEKTDGSGSGPSVRCIEIIPLENQDFIYLAGTSTGVYSTNQIDGLNTQWIFEEAIGNVVVPMIRFRPTDGTVIVGTHGNGMFSKRFSNVKPYPEVDFPETFILQTSFPNPFNHTVTASFNLPAEGIVRASIVNLLGQEVRMLYSEKLYAGSNVAIWDGKDNSGSALTEGIYFIRIQYEDLQITSKVIYNP
jgi:hypothetical protein